MNLTSRSRPAALLLSVLSLAASLTLVTSSVPASATPKPPPAASAPAGIEDLAAYAPAVSCTPTARPGTVKLGRLLTSTYPGTSFGGSRACGSLPDSEHHDGRAVDWMNSVRDAKQKKQAEAVISWLLSTDADGNRYANARRLGVMYVIWDNHIWGAYRPGDGWREYNGCTAASKSAKSLDSVCHRNHIHISLSWAGAMGRTSYWSGQVAAPDYGRCRPADLNWAYGYKAPNPTPCRSYPKVKAPAHSSTLEKTLVAHSGKRLSEGSRGAAVTAVQKAVHTKASGTYSSVTTSAVKRFQASKKIKATGKVDHTTWRALLKANAPH